MVVVKGEIASDGKGGGWRIVESLYMVCPGLFTLWRLRVLTWIGSLGKD